MKIRKTISKRDLKQFCRYQIYIDKYTAWQPFEYYSKEQLDEFVNGMYLSLISFLKREGVKK